MRRPRPNRTAYSGETDSIVFLLHRTAGPLDAASLGARFWTDALARHDGPDTVTTEALDASQRDALVDWLAGSQDRRVSAFVHETMTTLTAKRDIADAAAALLAVCVAGAAR